MEDVHARWRVEAAGSGGTPALLLPGGLGRAESLRPALAHLARTRRTLAVSYPVGLLEPEAVADSLEALLATEGGGPAHFIGVSLGAQVVRAIASRRPALFASAVLIGAGAPDPVRGARIARVLPLLRFMPAFLWRRRWRRELAGLLAGHAPEVACARAAMLGLLAAMPAREFVDGRRRLVIHDRGEGSALGAQSSRSVPASIPLLRLDFADEEVVSPAERARLTAIEPLALLETLPSQNHGATLTWPPALLSRLSTWLTTPASVLR